MVQRYLTPAEIAIKLFGGARPLSRSICHNDEVAFRWKRIKSENGNGCGGQIPVKYIKRILEVARERGIDLTPNDLVMGRTIEEVEEAPEETIEETSKISVLKRYRY